MFYFNWLSGCWEFIYYQFFHKNLSPLEFSGIYIPSALEGFSFVEFLIITNLLIRQEHKLQQVLRCLVPAREWIHRRVVGGDCGCIIQRAKSTQSNFGDWRKRSCIFRKKYYWWAHWGKGRPWWGLKHAPVDQVSNYSQRKRGQLEPTYVDINL